VFPLTCYLHADRAQMAPKKKTGGNLTKARAAKQPKPRTLIALDGSTLTDDKDNVIQLAVPEAWPSAAAPPPSGASSLAAVPPATAPLAPLAAVLPPLACSPTAPAASHAVASSPAASPAASPFGTSSPLRSPSRPPPLPPPAPPAQAHPSTPPSARPSSSQGPGHGRGGGHYAEEAARVEQVYVGKGVGERVFFSPGERLYVQGPGRGGGAGGGRYGRGTLWRLERIDGRFDMVHTPGGEERHSHLMCER